MHLSLVGAVAALAGCSSENCEPVPCEPSTTIYFSPADGWEEGKEYLLTYKSNEEGNCTFTYKSTRFTYCTGGMVEISSPTGLGVLALPDLHDWVDVKLEMGSDTLFDESLTTKEIENEGQCGGTCEGREGKAKS